MAYQYKIVLRDPDSDNRCSYVVNQSNNVRVMYTVGQFVEAPKFLANMGYHLTVFDSLAAASDFFVSAQDLIRRDGPKTKLRKLKESRHPNMEVWAVECEEQVTGLPVYLNYSSADSWDNFTRADALAERHRSCYSSWPMGTKMFKRVKLVKQII